VNLNTASSVHSVTESVDHGYDLHLEDIKDPWDLEQALMYLYVALSITIVASTFGKVTMALFLVRILGRSAEKRYLWFLYSVTFAMVGLIMFAIGVLVGGWFPMQKARIPSLSGMCINSDMLEYGGRIQGQ
jgi:ABC-type Na+ efflux pump permease subunit